MVRKATEAPAVNAAAGAPAAAETTDAPAKRRRRPAAAAKTEAASEAGGGVRAPSFADAARGPQPKPAAAAEQQRPKAEPPAEDTFVAGMHEAGEVAGKVFGAIRDTAIKGVGVAHDLSQNETVQQGAAVVGRHKAAAATAVAVAVVGTPAVLLGGLAAGVRFAQKLANGEDPLQAGKDTYAEANKLADQATGLAGQALESVGRVGGWLAAFGKKTDKPE